MSMESKPALTSHHSFVYAFSLPSLQPQYNVIGATNIEAYSFKPNASSDREKEDTHGSRHLQVDA